MRPRGKGRAAPDRCAAGTQAPLTRKPLDLLKRGLLYRGWSLRPSSHTERTRFRAHGPRDAERPHGLCDVRDPESGFIDGSATRYARRSGPCGSRRSGPPGPLDAWGRAVATPVIPAVWPVRRFGPPGPRGVARPHGLCDVRDPEIGSTDGSATRNARRFGPPDPPDARGRAVAAPVIQADWSVRRFGPTGPRGVWRPHGFCDPWDPEAWHDRRSSDTDRATIRAPRFARR